MMTPIRTATALVALMAATPALAQTPSNDDLAALVRQQAAEIATLRARLDRLEGTTAAAAPAPVAATAPAPTASPAPQLAQSDTIGRDTVTRPFAPQLVPPGPAERDVAQARQANAAGVTTEWGAGLPVFRGRSAVISLERQVRIAAGLLVLAGAVLALAVHPLFVLLSGFVGAGLTFAGLTDTCGMALVLAKMPWNRAGSSPPAACAVRTPAGPVTATSSPR